MATPRKSTAKRPTSDQWDVEEFLASYVPPQRTLLLCSDGRLLDKLELLIAEFFELEAGDPERVPLGEQVEAASNEVKAAQRPFVLQSLGGDAWRRLVGEHPPTDEQREAGLDYDFTSLPPQAISACSVSPKLTPEQVVELSETLSLGEFAALWQTCRHLNVDDPTERYGDRSLVSMDLYRRAKAEAGL